MFWSGTICTLLHTSKKTGKTEKKKGAKKKTDSDWNRCVTVWRKKTDSDWNRCVTNCLKKEDRQWLEPVCDCLRKEDSDDSRCVTVCLKKEDSDWNRCVTVCLKKEKNAMDVYDVLNATKTTFRTQQKEEKKWGWRKQNMYENTYTHTPSLSLILSSLNTQYDIKLKQIQSATLLLE